MFPVSDWLEGMNIRLVQACSSTVSHKRDACATFASAQQSVVCPGGFSRAAGRLVQPLFHAAPALAVVQQAGEALERVAMGGVFGQVA